VTKYVDKARQYFPSQLYYTHSRCKYRVRSPKFIWAPLHSCTHWLRPRISPPFPPHLGSYTRALLVSADRRHLFVTPLLCIPVSLGVGWRVWRQWRPFEARLPFVVGVGENLNPPCSSLWEARFREVHLEPEFVNVKEPMNRFQGIDSASLCSLSLLACQTGTITLFVVPARQSTNF
jgi:hypothetical protein